jgi:hypothetical protein
VISSLGYITLRVAWVDSRPKSCPERVVANNLRGEILGSVVRIR